ncbi:MAG: PadR family transcriptional regulator [Promethearchaeota archaeon]
MADITDLKIQNLTKLYTLVLLKSKDSVTGYFILKRLGSDLGKTSSPTYIYDFLKSLKEKGYIEEIATEKNERSKGYRLTSSGSAFTDRIFSRFDNLIDVAIQSKLEICSSCGVKLYKNYHTETIHGKEMNFCCKHCAKAYKNSHNENL